MDQAIFDKVKEMIVNELEVEADAVVPDAVIIDDLGADSLDVVEFIMALEEEFSVEIPDEDAEQMKTVGDVVTYISNNS